MTIEMTKITSLSRQTLRWYEMVSI